MGVNSTDKVFIFAGRATKELAGRVAEKYGIPLGKSEVFQYADGEFQPSFEESIRGGVVFIIQSTIPPTDNLFELLMMVDAARRASASKVVAVIPYYGFARQDRKDKPHVPIASKMIANMLTAAGVDRIVTMDLHADQIQGYFDIPVDHLFGSSLFMPYIREKFTGDDVLFASPDLGGSRRAGMYAKMLDNGFVMCYKHRNKPNEIGEMRLIGDVRDKHVILLDDIIDTGTTICKAAGIIMDNGAKSVRAMITHPVLSGSAIEKVENSALEELVVADTIPLRRQSSKIHVLSTDWLIAEALRRIVSYESIENLYETTIHRKGVPSKF
ncbi:MAG: ribose-phosphate pyrophosphokinase [Bacteroidales bacterium]|nr:ribose-phosphate pyrophosphokinase [Candidatus Colimorpha onthohippi]